MKATGTILETTINRQLRINAECGMRNNYFVAMFSILMEQRIRIPHSAISNDATEIFNHNFNCNRDAPARAS